jgi:hypothetical protein
MPWSPTTANAAPGGFDRQRRKSPAPVAAEARALVPIRGTARFLLACGPGASRGRHWPCLVKHPAATPAAETVGHDRTPIGVVAGHDYGAGSTVATGRVHGFASGKNGDGSPLEQRVRRLNLATRSVKRKRARVPTARGLKVGVVCDQPP